MGEIVSMIGVPDFDKFRIVATGTIDVTRNSNSDTGSNLVGVNIDTSVLFFCYVFNPSASPAFSFPCPVLTFATSGANSGLIYTQKRAYYDPSVGVVKCVVDSTDVNPSYGTAETWRFRYYFLAQKSN